MLKDPAILVKETRNSNVLLVSRQGAGPPGRERGDSRDPRDHRDTRGEPRGQRGDPRGEPRGELRPDHRGDHRDPRRRSHGSSPNGYLPFVVEGPPRPMIAVYDYDPVELSPNVDSEVLFGLTSYVLLTNCTQYIEFLNKS